MRAKFTDQDLTDYALNEQDPTDRLYIESMLAASEECRNDVCKIIELAQILEDGFEREAGAAQAPCLKPEQREVLSKPHFRLRYLLRDVVSLLGLAACVAFACIQFQRVDTTNPGTAAGRMAEVTNQISTTVAQVVHTPEAADMTATMESLRAMVADPSNWLPLTESLPEPPELCTPPTFVMESAQLNLDLIP